MVKKYVAELIGTAVLVLLGCGSVVLGGYGGAFPVGIFPVAFSFGLAVTAMAYTIGPISGCHINPAVTVSMVVAGRMSPSDAVGYIISQIVGGAAIQSVWVFLIMPLIGGAIAGWLFRAKILTSE